MKKVIIILAIALFASCTPSEDTDTEANVDLTNCNCGTITSVNAFTVVSPNGGSDTFYIVKIKNNCTGEIKTVEKSFRYVANTQICNY